VSSRAASSSEIALAEPGTELGEPPEPRFHHDPRVVDVDAALTAFEREACELRARLRQTPTDQWHFSVTIGADHVDVHWIVRHALHDVTHHLGDVLRLRAAL
jgi:hypothetical protein